MLILFAVLFWTSRAFHTLKPWVLLQYRTTCLLAKALADVGHGSLLRSAALSNSAPLAFWLVMILTGSYAPKDSLWISLVHSCPFWSFIPKPNIIATDRWGFFKPLLFPEIGMQAGGVKMCEPFEDARNFSSSRDPMMTQCFWPFGDVRESWESQIHWSDLVGSGRISEGKNLWWLEETKWSAGAPKPIRAVAWSSHVQLHQAAGVNILTQTAGVRLFHFTAFHRMWHISHTSEIQPTYSCPYLL